MAIEVTILVESPCEGHDEPCCSDNFTCLLEELPQRYLRRLRDDPDTWLVRMQVRKPWVSPEEREKMGCEPYITERDMEEMCKRAAAYEF